MLLVEVEVTSRPRIAYAYKPNQELKKKSLDLINEQRNQTALRTVEYQRRISKYYNSKVRQRSFQKGNLILRRIMTNVKHPTDDPLGPN